MFNRRQRAVLAEYVPPLVDSSTAKYPASLYIILKATRLCNLRCSYCTAWREGPNQVITFEVLTDLVAQAMRLPGVKWLHIIWHGGETTLLSRKFFKQAMWLQEHFRVDARKVGHAIQTNATLIDGDWADFFKATGISVGVSLDVDAEAHDRSRVFRDGEGSYAATIAGIRVLRDHGVPHGILAVVDEQLLTRGAAHLLAAVAEQGIESIGLLNALPPNTAQPEEAVALGGACRDAATGATVGSGDGQPYLAWDRYVGFLRDIFREWHARYRGVVTVLEVGSLFGIVRGGASRLCIYQGGCMGQYLTIEPDGRVSACDKYVGDPTHGFGSLADQTLQQILNDGEALVRVRADSEALLARFVDCPNHIYCRGGCPHDARLNLQHGRTGSCCGLSGLIKDIKNRIEETTNG